MFRDRFGMLVRNMLVVFLMWYVKVMIELIDFGKDYGDFIVVEWLNLKIEVGEMFGFIGFNGVGKSTTICFLMILLKVF